ncbi:AdoMet_MTases domain containing protein [uncultured Caudovirales phage]|uniref:AdoMet_MTases domain containing protein n=1 Tax=uncultured Caudovirales phage TaxID=2100421 RepID=A0A6J5SDE8_9CAUD|nr:AdoMet_MTases domain containing protein [uncultured Caudovirales phage]
MTWSLETSNGFESRKIKYLLPRYTRGRVLEIGCGQEKAFPHFIGYDSGHHFGKGAADLIGDAATLSLFADESFDAVFSSHVLEHMDDMQAALNEWSRVIKPGGYLCIYVPSANFYPKCGEPGANPDHKHDIYPGDVEGMLGRGWVFEIREERDQDDEYSLLLIARKIPFVRDGEPKEYHRDVKTACICRFGGFGDMVQTALIFPRLKELGYHVTVMTTPRGQEIIKHDPNVDDWYIVDTDQVPNRELFDFWKVQAGRFDLFVNLSESIEGTLLALPGRPNHSWPHEVRKKRMNTNYHEWTAELAGVPFKPCRLFYPTDDEKIGALTLLTRHTSPAFNVVWALSGSSQHKFTPHMDAVMARILMEMPEAQILLVGDEACKILEQGWESEPRVICLSGGLSIRETLALAGLSALVIGPETGVLNAVGFEEVNKVLLLSHSSDNNLSKHWKNVQALTPVGCSCYPCHRLHYSSEYCAIVEETGAALCAQNIEAHVIYAAVEKVYKKWGRK